MGEYTVSFHPEKGNYVPQYYNEQSTRAAATPVKITTLPETKSSINAKLTAGGQIKGKVTPEGSTTGLKGVSACAEAKIGTEEYVERCAVTNPGGEYTIEGLPSGSYTVSFYAYEGNYLSTTLSTVPVVAPNPTNGQNATLKPGGLIAGMITAATGGGPVAGEACAYLASGYPSGCAYANSNGEYVIDRLIKGTYEVRFYPYSCVEESCTDLNYVGTKVPGVSVTEGATTPNINAALATAGQITGVVTDAATHARLLNVWVCASLEAKEPKEEEFFENCALTTGASAAGVANSNALAVPAPISAFKIKGKPKFNSKTGKLVFTIEFANAGSLSWSLFFRNADVGFADSLAISLGEGGPSAEAARKHHKRHKAKKCKKGFTKHKGKCVRILVPFGSGTQNVAAPGTVTVEVAASKKALKALKDHRTLHVSGTFTFQSALGGSPSTQKVSVVVHPPKKKAKHKGKHGHSKHKKG